MLEKVSEPNLEPVLMHRFLMRKTRYCTICTII